VASKVERFKSEAADIDAVPLANQERALTCSIGLQCLLVDSGLKGRCRCGQTASTGAHLASINDSHNAYATVRAIDAQVANTVKGFAVNEFLDLKRS
jgi:hypothetical protein